MDLGIKTEVFSASEDQRWLGSAHGTNECESITLDADAFLADFTEGFVPSGVSVGLVAATGLYVPAADADVASKRYVLFTTKAIEAGANVSAAGFWHGQIIEANLPVGHGFLAADFPHIDTV